MMVVQDNPIDSEFSYTIHTQGAATTLPVEAGDEKIRRLHEVVEEVTGRKVEKPAKPRIGFLP